MAQLNIIDSTKNVSEETFTENLLPIETIGKIES